MECWQDSGHDVTLKSELRIWIETVISTHFSRWNWLTFHDFHLKFQFSYAQKKTKLTAWESPAFPRIRWESWNYKKLPFIFFAENHPQSSMFANFPAFVLRGKPLYGYYQLIWPKKKKPPATESPSVWRKKAFNEGDEGLKLEGVLNIGAFIAQSERLVVVWDSTYATRAWLLGWSPLKPNIFCGWGTN